MQNSNIDVVMDDLQGHEDSVDDADGRSAYILIRPHPHASGKANPSPDDLKDLQQIIPLDGQPATNSSRAIPATCSVLPGMSAPWAPFRSRVDFEWFETVYDELKPDKIKRQLNGLHSSWSKNGTNISFQTYDDVQFQKEKVRELEEPFLCGRVDDVFMGIEYTVEFEYRDLMAWVRRIAQDRTLLPYFSWYSVEKTLHTPDGVVETLIDEPETGRAWAEADDKLPDPDPYPHALFPMLFWFDKGLVTKHVKMHPIAVYPLGVTSSIRNGSGNGGAYHLGLMQEISTPAFILEKRCPRPQKKAWGRFKRGLYQKVLAKVVRSGRDRSHGGAVIECSDDVTRVVHPSVHILSLDAEEASHCNCTRGPMANHPCPKCNVHRKHLGDILSRNHVLRTKDKMREILKKARAMGSTSEAEKLLKKHGLHDVEQFLDDFAFSDAYRAYAYDILHSDDEGKWGKHLYKFIVKVLEDRGGVGKFRDNMRNIPHWSGLRHFNDITKPEALYDGDQYLDILRVILPCLANLRPRDDALVHDIRAYQRVRMTLALRLQSTRRREALTRFIRKYEETSKALSAAYDDDDLHKEFDFLKQHLTAHAPGDIADFGAPHNYTTRPREGLHQIFAAYYARTNYRDVESQINEMDRLSDAMAGIRIRVDIADEEAARIAKEHRESDDLIDEAGNSGPSSAASSPSFSSGGQTAVESSEGAHWVLSAPLSRKKQNSVQYSRDISDGSFHPQLHTFLQQNFPEIFMRDPGSAIPIRAFQRLVLEYQSMDDLKLARDLLHCKAKFFDEPRYDCAILNEDSPNVTLVRLHGLYQCKITHDHWEDVARVSYFRETTYQPWTAWDGCTLAVLSTVYEYRCLSDGDFPQ
ncbi:unnamed protein product [Peniophora sp. CBMAI 1063]|nr:unnamed protein product [Peniophora sp. CBMAI 1063]